MISHFYPRTSLCAQHQRHGTQRLPLLILTPVLLILFLLFESVAFAEKPNIVLILADDMGYGDVQALNSQSKIETPNLNRLAKQGMTFTDAHTPSSVCTPTRYGLLTGRYCWRTSLKRGVLNGYGKPLIKRERETLADFLAAQGYRTGIVGKWHLGLEFTRNGKEIDFRQPIVDGPNQHGFNYSYIIPASLDFPPYVYIEDGKVTDSKLVEQKAQKFPRFLRKGPRSRQLVMEECFDQLASKATDFVKRNSQKKSPFFLYVPLTAPHKPVIAHKRFRGKTGQGEYGDFVHQVDATVGAILKSLDDHQVSRNTLVIYTSDNGSFMHRLTDPSAPDHVTDSSIQGYKPSSHQANGELRGTKADIWEAGHRVPFFVRLPGQVKPGSTSGKTICLTDIFATCADVIGASLAESSAPDSFSFLPLLQGDGKGFQRAPVIHHSAAGMFAIRQGDWKLVLGSGSGGRQKPRGKPFEKPYHLSNLSIDLSETKNFLSENTLLAKELEEKCQAIIDNGRSR